MNNQANCATIPSVRPFLDTLAAQLLKRYGQDPFLLSNTLILLPNRRSCRALKEAFIRQTSGKACLLPAIHPLGDTADELWLDSWPLQKELADEAPRLSILRRRLILARMVMAAHPSMHAAQATELAAQLADLLDEATRSAVALDNLNLLVPDYFSAHWQKTLDVLKLLTHHWPQLLEQNHWLDPVEAQQRDLLSLAKKWQHTPPDYPVIAAGSTGSQPATAMLLGVIASLPSGTLVLPSVDMEMSQTQWEALPVTHPQYALSQLLSGMGIKRSEIAIWGEELTTREEQRLRWVHDVFSSPEATATWHHQSAPCSQQVNGISILTATTQIEEARMIAVVLRETLERPGETAALVTPDRTLASMVVQQMRRFNVALNDSSGMPLSEVPEGVFMHLVMAWLAQETSSIRLLALLRHPLAALGMAGVQCRQLARRLELLCLRGLQYEDDWRSIAARLDDQEISQFIISFCDRTQVLRSLLSQPKVSPVDLLLAHLQVCELLAATDTEPGDGVLWKRETGAALSRMLADLIEQVKDFPAIEPAHYDAWLASMLGGAVFRPAYGLHPRLTILSPMEARLHSFDRVILAGLNEGIWPSLPEASPWLSRPMKREIGMPSAERSVGQSAHDFYQLMGCREVILSRSRKVDGVVQVPSRWLVRMQTLTQGLNQELWEAMQMSDRYRRMSDQLDQPISSAPFTKPEPCPAVSDRATSLSTTQLERLALDPYACYAETILRLKPLNPLDEQPSGKHFGMIIHRALEQFVQSYPASLPADANAALMSSGAAAFAEMMRWPSVCALWWPRFQALVPWIMEQEKNHRALTKRIVAEYKAQWLMPCRGEVIKLTARIDRLEIRRDGTVAIVDYKTGALPTPSDLKRLKINQLALYAIILSHGEAPSPSLTLPRDYHQYKLYYWRLAGGLDQCENQELQIHMDEVQQTLKSLVAFYRDPSTVFSSHDDPSLGLQHNPYEHLSRRAEWAGL